MNNDQNKPFNDAINHLQTHIGMPGKVDLKRKPLFIRLIGYILFGLMGIMAFVIVIGIILTQEAYLMIRICLHRLTGAA